MTLPQFVTFTGVDERTDLDRVKEMSARYPIEWGVLFGGTMGPNRYPAHETIAQVLKIGVRLSAHLCGPFSRFAMSNQTNQEFIGGIVTNKDRPGDFRRMQINALRYNERGVARFQRMIKLPVIIQVREDEFPASQDGITFLHDPSGGKGLVPPSRPIQQADTPLVGYAGGIGPDNVAEVIAGLQAHTYYLDMETKVRTDDWLDLDKCETVCKAIWG